MTTSTRKYAIAPDPTLMEDIGATSFTVAEAIAELVANSLDARPAVDEVVSVEVTVNPEFVSVVDDGKGMSADILAEAVRLGVKMDKISGNTAPRKGTFGLGLKTAAASLGRDWELRTRPKGATEEHSVRFDLAEWTRHAGDKAFEWAVEIETSPVRNDGPLGSSPSGTIVVIRRLRERNPMAGPVLEKLGQAYKPNLEAGDTIRVNGTKATPPAYDYFPESRRVIDLQLAGGRRITGWVALDKRTHNDDFFGINLYREGQLIEPWNKTWFKVHLMTSRIIGEVNLDFVRPNYFKRGFETQSVEWKLASAAMEQELKDLVRASRTMAIGKKDATRFARALQGLQRAANKTADIALDPSGSGAEQPAAFAPSVGPIGAQDVDLAPDTLYLPDPVHLVYLVSDLGSDLTPWAYVYDDEVKELQAVLNSSSRLYEQTKDSSFIGTLALADCVSAFLSDERGFTPAQAREVRDRWLYVAMAEE